MSNTLTTPAQPILPPPPSGDYQLLDSGNERKLEQIGPYLIVRPAPQAIWASRLPASTWQRAQAVYQRDRSGSGVCVVSC